MAFLKAHGHTLVDSGSEIVPIMKGKKAPMIKGWQEIRATHDDVDKWLANGHADGGVGVLCRNTVAVDIDCLDAPLNHKLLRWLDENVGKSAIRVGQKPKCILPFRVDGKFSKIRSWEYEDELGSKHAVEVLAEGQQFVAYGIHPSTNEPYKWVRGKSIADIPQSDLPTISKDQAEAFVAYFEELAEQQEGWELARKGMTPAEIDPDDLSMFKPKMDMDNEQVRQLLESVDPDCHHDEWVRVGMALHHQFDGSDEGWHIWDEWSSTGSKYNQNECERRYATFDAKGRTPITLASVKAMEKEQVSAEIKEERLPKMLREWAFVQVEGSARVIREDLNKHNNIVLYKLEDLKKEHMNCRVLSGDEKPKLINLVDMWLEHPERRTYAAGLTFAPDMQILEKYNLWRGWSVEAEEGDIEPWLKFITEVIADGNEAYATYIIAWAAQMIQNPMTKIGVGLVLRGRKGTGKTKFGEILGGLVKAHHKIVSRAEHVTGNFNRHLEDTLLLQADEAYWAGAKASEGALKDLLTNPNITIERKGVDAYTAANYTRILFTSNEEFVVPASLDERRFAVFDVSECHKQDSEYFAALDNWYNTGGAEALLHYLRNFNLSNINLRLVPQTDALTDQKIEALDNVNEWLYNCLQNGEIRENRVGGNVIQFGSETPKAEIYDIYTSSLKGNKFEVAVKSAPFWKKLKVYGDMFTDGSYKCEAGHRYRTMKINSVESARFIFEATNNLTIEWATLDIGAVEADPFDPNNWDD